MLIAGGIIGAVILSLFGSQIKGKHKVLVYFALIVLPMLYLFYNPLYEEDLYRHYVVLNDMERSDDIRVASIATFALDYPGYLALVRLVSLIGIKELLPVISGILLYFIIIFCVEDILYEYNCNHWVYGYCFAITYLLIRYVDIAGIRNILASTFFAAGLYYDLIKGKKRYLIFYILAVSFHSIAVVYLILRLFLMVYRRYNTFFIKVILLFSVSIITYACNFITFMISRLPWLGNLVNMAQYYLSGKGMAQSLSYMLFYIMLYLLVLGLCNYIAHHLPGKFNRLCDYIILVIFMSFGFIGQREMFNRNRMLIIPLFIFLIAYMLGNIAGTKFPSIAIDGTYVKSKKDGVMALNLIVFILVYSLLYFCFLCKDYAIINSRFY